MAVCINRSSGEFQTLLERSGISEFQLDAECSYYLENYGRYPNLDELSGSNSEPYLRKLLDINSDNGANIDLINTTLNTNSLEEANIKVNKEFTDLQVEFTPIVSECLVDITKRPTTFNPKIELVRHDKNIDSASVFNYQLEKLANLYGINFIPVTSQELSRGKLKNIIPNASITKAFVYNNNIYINTDLQSLDAPLHEMMHIFLGSIRFTNPDLYFSLVSLAEKFPNYKIIASKYPNRSRGDLNEEVFINEYAKNVSGLSNSLEILPKEIKYEINYNIKRLIDSILFGQLSVKSLDEKDLYNSSLNYLARILQSNSFNSKFEGTLDTSGAEAHRILANVKEDLFKKGELKEYCL